MKKILLSLAAFVMIMANANAQTEKGKIMAGGSLGLSFGNSYNEYDGNKGMETTQFSVLLEPTVGYFVTDALAVGLEIGLSNDTEKDEDDNKTTLSAFLVSPFARYYTPVGLFGEAAIGIGSSKFESGDDIEGKNGIFAWSLGAGYAIFLNDNVSIEPMVSYNKVVSTDNEDSKFKSKTGQLMIEVGFNIFL